MSDAGFNAVASLGELLRMKSFGTFGFLAEPFGFELRAPGGLRPLAAGVAGVAAAATKVTVPHTTFVRSAD